MMRCPTCRGTGKLGTRSCGDCAGHGHAPSTRGGARPGAGRPPSDPAVVRSVRKAVFLTEDEAALVDRAVDIASTTSGETKTRGDLLVAIATEICDTW